MKSSYSEESTADLKHAYRELGVPLESSAPTIKRAYRRLVKNWHPDRWTSDTSRQQAATERMKELNNAYSQIRHAPLRYHIETFPRLRRPATPTFEAPPYHETIPVTDYLETGVRFASGFVFGLLLAVNLMPLRAAWLSIVIILPLTCGYCAVRFGDRFWHWILEKAWLWW